MAEAYIVAAARTAGGRKGGRLAGWHPADLAAKVLDELVDRTKVDPALVEDVIMGCVMQVGEQSNNVARNAIMASKLPGERGRAPLSTASAAPPSRHCTSPRKP